MRLFSLLYIAALQTVHAHYFSCVLLLVMYVCACVCVGGGD